MFKLSRILKNLGWGLVVASSITSISSAQYIPTVDEMDACDQCVKQKQEVRKGSSKKDAQKRKKAERKNKKKRLKQQQDERQIKSSDEEAKATTPAKSKKTGTTRKARSRKAVSKKMAALPVKSIPSPVDLKTNKSVQKTTLPQAGVQTRYNKPITPIIFDRTSNVVRFTSASRSPKTELKQKTTKQGEQKQGWKTRFANWRKSSQNFVLFQGEKYFFDNVDFHTPVAHSLDGKKDYPVEMHILNKSADGKILVLATFITEGKFNKSLQPLVGRLDAMQGKNMTAIKGYRLNPRTLLPPYRNGHDVYMYHGTTIAAKPMQDAIWFMYQKPVEMSAEQIETIIRAVANKPLAEKNSGEMESE